MLNYFEYMTNPETSAIFLYCLFLILGLISGVLCTRKIKGVLSVCVFYLFLPFLMKTVDYHSTYKPEYKECHIQKNVESGYKMLEGRCYRPYFPGEYVSVTNQPKTVEDFK